MGLILGSEEQDISRDDFPGSGLHHWVFLELLRAIGNNVCLDGKDGEFGF